MSLFGFAHVEKHGKVNLVNRSLLLIKLSFTCHGLINHRHQLKIQQVDASNISVILPMLEAGQLFDYKTQCGEEMPRIGKVNLVARSLLLIKLSLNCLGFINHGHYLNIQQVDVSNISPAVITRQLRAAKIHQVGMV